MATADDKVYVTKTVTIGLADITIKNFTDAATKVNAPSDARLNTSGSMPPNPTDTSGPGGTPANSNPYSVTFSWSESI